MVNVQTDLRAEIQVLSIAHSLAQSISKKITASYQIPALKSSHSHSPSPTPSIPTLVLPYPHEILAPISNLPIPVGVRQELLQCFTLRIAEIQKHYQTTYQRACSATSPTPFYRDFQHLQQIYRSLYQRHCLPLVRKWVNYALEEVARRQQFPHSPKRSFNNECTPVLERYFQFNGYPTATHRSVLAKATHMSVRQIEVWFQNHRNRAKKDGQTVKRLSSDAPLKQALMMLKDTPTLNDSVSSDAGEDDDVEEIIEHAPEPTSCLEGFEAPRFRPSHVFPTRFSESRVGPDPFPHDNGVFKFSKPSWTRKSTTVPTGKSDSVIDIDELATLFRLKLSFFERRRGAAASAPFEPRSPWFASTVTIPFRRRHPAFTPCSVPIIPTSNKSLVDFCQFPAGSGNTNSSNAFLSLSRSDPLQSPKLFPFQKQIPTSSKFYSISSPSIPSSRSSSSSSSTTSGSRTSSSGTLSRESSTPLQYDNDGFTTFSPEFPIDNLESALFNYPDTNQASFLEPSFSGSSPIFSRQSITPMTNTPLMSTLYPPLLTSLDYIWNSSYMLESYS